MAFLIAMHTNCGVSLHEDKYIRYYPLKHLYHWWDHFTGEAVHISHCMRMINITSWHEVDRGSRMKLQSIYFNFPMLYNKWVTHPLYSLRMLCSIMWTYMVQLQLSVLDDIHRARVISLYTNIPSPSQSYLFIYKYTIPKPELSLYI